MGTSTTNSREVLGVSPDAAGHKMFNLRQGWMTTCRNMASELPVSNDPMGDSFPGIRAQRRGGLLRRRSNRCSSAGLNFHPRTVGDGSGPESWGKQEEEAGHVCTQRVEILTTDHREKSRQSCVWVLLWPT
ncbi:uncharacterized protein LOC102081697 isoform X5 [Oreochromis niloticus]|uniref:uncharacterized protein LOC102081697 isoform X5 n=1 Tax=Oreochromis niloticus TaxID=8128 RepID=UPI000DF16815|nr:uncharacterized protein LOC102081697 isoform X5 [Oreochromis niloticus]